MRIASDPHNPSAKTTTLAGRCAISLADAADRLAGRRLLPGSGSGDVPVRSADQFAGREANAPHAVRHALNAGVRLQDFEAAIRRLRYLLDNPPEQIGV